MFYMNLDALPADKEMYMVAIISDPHSTDYDEFDIVLDRGLGKDGVLAGCRANAEFVECYGPDAIIAGAINQSEGYVIFEDIGR